MQSTAKLAGVSEMQWATLPHPVGSRTEEELQALAKSAMEQCLNVLTGRD